MMDDEWDSYLSTGSALLLTSQITFLQLRVPVLEQICWRPVKITISPHQLLAVGFFIIYVTKLQREASYQRNRGMKTCFSWRFSALRVPYSRVKHEWQITVFWSMRATHREGIGQFRIWDKGSNGPKGAACPGRAQLALALLSLPCRASAHALSQQAPSRPP